MPHSFASLFRTLVLLFKVAEKDYLFFSSILFALMLSNLYLGTHIHNLSEPEAAEVTLHSMRKH